MADKKLIPADRYRGQIYDGPENFSDIEYFREGPRGKSDLFQDVSKNYVKNPTPQAAYAISKAAKNTPSGTVEDEVAAIRKGPAAQKEYFDSLNERIVKAGREADNEMKREAGRAETMKAVNNKKGGKVCGMKKGGKVRGCGIAQRGLTKGKMR